MQRLACRLFPPLTAIARCVPWVALAFLSVGVPGVAAAQTAEPVRPLELLLQQRESLALTPDQLTRLEGIRSQLAATNEPLITRMMTLRAQWQRARRATRKTDSPQAAALVKRIRASADQIRARLQHNNQMAMQSVNRVLTRDQRAQLKAIVDERRRQTGPSAGRETGAGDLD